MRPPPCCMLEPACMPRPPTTDACAVVAGLAVQMDKMKVVAKSENL
jgi:hypothetical protein